MNEGYFTPEQIEQHPELLNEPLSSEELIAYWTKKQEEMVEVLVKGNPDNLPFVEIMKPKQMLYNLMWMLKAEEFEKLKAKL